MRRWAGRVLLAALLAFDAVLAVWAVATGRWPGAL